MRLNACSHILTANVSIINGGIGRQAGVGARDGSGTDTIHCSV